MPRLSCPKCGYRKGTWKVRRNNHVCARCRHEWNSGSLPLRLTAKQWRKLLEWFILDLSSNKITERTGINKPRILRALMCVRKVMATDVPEILSGVVEVDETYVGGQWKNKRKSARAQGTKRGRGTSKQPVFGIHARKGMVWADIVSDVEARTLQPLIRKKVRRGSTINSDSWRGYTGIAASGYVHRLVDHGKEYVRGRTHVNGLEGFWGYLKRKLAAKGGIRRERLHLYLAEYVWRFNHRKLPVNQQVNKLMKLLRSRRN